MGLALFVAGVRDKQGDLFTLVHGDFTGAGNFIYWVLSILIVGSVGYVKDLKPLSDAFLMLILIVLFLTKGTGFFDQFGKQIATTQTAPPVVPKINIDQTIANSGGSYLTGDNITNNQALQALQNVVQIGQ